MCTVAECSFWLDLFNMHGHVCCTGSLSYCYMKEMKAIKVYMYLCNDVVHQHYCQMHSQVTAIHKLSQSVAFTVHVCC